MLQKKWNKIYNHSKNRIFNLNLILKVIKILILSCCYSYIIKTEIKTVFYRSTYNDIKVVLFLLLINSYVNKFIHKKYKYSICKECSYIKLNFN